MKELTEADFDQYVSSPEVTMIDFWATWCSPCRMVAPTLEKLTEYRIAKVNTEENMELARRFNISSIPAFLFFKNGKVIHRVAGLQSERTFRTLFEDLKN